MCRSAVNDGSCSPWVMCSCSVVRGNQIRDTAQPIRLKKHKNKKLFRYSYLFIYIWCAHVHWQLSSFM